MGDVLLREQELDLLEPFAKARHRLVRRDAEAAELVWQECARKAHVKPPAGDRIEHADFPGKLERVVEDRKHCAGHKPHVARTLRGRAQEDDGIGAIAAIGLKIVLDGAHMGETQLVGFGRDVERVVEIIPRRFLLRRYIGKELKAELHDQSWGSLLLRCWIRCSSRCAVRLSAAASAARLLPLARLRSCSLMI